MPYSWYSIVVASYLVVLLGSASSALENWPDVRKAMELRAWGLSVELEQSSTVRWFGIIAGLTLGSAGYWKGGKVA